MLELDYRYITEQIPDKLRRTPIRLDFLHLQTIPLKNDWLSFKNNEYKDSNFIVKHNSQVKVMEHLLNSYLVNPQYEITISDGVWYPYVNLYFYEDNVFEKTIIYDETDDTKDQTELYTYKTYRDEQVDFFVNVNNADSSKENLIRYYVELFQPGGKIYEINII